ncbi:MAG: hypothetical protein IJX77_10340 [Ruminococcus sp.]|nr:hypothetical protein [Ruminococcus sp.]
MNIPEKVKIAGYEYTVERPTEPFLVDNDACDGVHIFTQQKIKVAQTGNEAYQNTVFIHELVHGIIMSYCKGCDNYDEEKFTEQFSKGIYQVITDNPEIFR